ncbi:DnaB-like helicase N-terminal domain-containing protein, partial [Synechococcus sp. EJ6-Ellesmere]
MVSVPLPAPDGGPEWDTAGEGSDRSATAAAALTPAFRRRGRDQDEARFEALPDQVPPQNLEAEEAVLGGILLDPDALGRIADVLRPEAFYLGAHREIYRTALMLHGQGKPTDLTAMAAWLADTGQL